MTNFHKMQKCATEHFTKHNLLTNTTTLEIYSMNVLFLTYSADKKIKWSVSLSGNAHVEVRKGELHFFKSQKKQKKKNESNWIASCNIFHWSPVTFITWSWVSILWNHICVWIITLSSRGKVKEYRHHFLLLWLMQKTMDCILSLLFSFL